MAKRKAATKKKAVRRNSSKKRATRKNAPKMIRCKAVGIVKGPRGNPTHIIIQK